MLYNQKFKEYVDILLWAIWRNNIKLTTHFVAIQGSHNDIGIIQ